MVDTLNTPRISTARALEEVNIVLMAGRGVSFVTPTLQSHRIARVLAQSEFPSDALGRKVSSDEMKDLEHRMSFWAHQELMRGHRRKKKRSR